MAGEQLDVYQSILFSPEFNHSFIQGLILHFAPLKPTYESSFDYRKEP